LARRVELEHVPGGQDGAVGAERLVVVGDDGDACPVEVLLRELRRRDRLPELLRRRLDVDRVDLGGERGLGNGAHASSCSSLVLRSVSAETWRSVYLSIQRSWISRIGTGFRWCSFSRPERRVTTRPASSSTRRCFMTPKRDISSSDSSSVSVRPSRSKS